jgi:hypothetical protein
MRIRQLAITTAVCFVCACAHNNKGDMPPQQTGSPQTKSKSDKTAKDAAPVAVSGATVCKHGSEERMLKVATKANGGCETLYTKSGKESVVASGSKGTGSCESVVAKIRANLESAGYQCK